MRKAKEILRQKWLLGRSHRAIAASAGVGVGSVSEVAGRAHAAGLATWDAIDALDEAALEARLYPARAGERPRPLPDPAYLHTELRRKGVTLQLLHVEYLEQHPGGYGYTQFCEHYRSWLKRHAPTMRQVHRAGEKLFVDYSGKKPSIADPHTGECVEVELFVAVLGASNYTYVEATLTQRGPDWIASHIRALDFLGGVPAALVPDQLKSGVTRPCCYEPGIQRTYADLAGHYGTAVAPARPLHPRDKAKVETGVLVAQRWILARLRNQTFFSLDELNGRIAELVDELNDRTMKVYRESRRQLFERLDRPALRPLPTARFVYGEWKQVRVNIDYHVEVDGHYYSVHHSLIHEQLDARVSATTVEVFRRGERVASHRRSFERGRHTTVAEHMPKHHQKHLEWSPSRLAHWAGTIGPRTAQLVEAILADRPHPEQGYRSCLGILRLGKRYGDERLEAACRRALLAGARSYRHVESILKHGLDRAPVVNQDDAPVENKPIHHENVRGRDYYH
jgi:transposase